MGFVEGFMAGEKVFGDRVFPKTLLPPIVMESPGPHDLVELVKQESLYLAGALQRHGALLFRGFGLASAQDFSRVIDAFGWEECAYVGAGDRKKVAHRVYTASDTPLDLFIPFHHEMSFVKNFPSKVFLFCLQPSPEGGETAIIPSDTVVEKMKEKAPLVVERLAREGMRFVIHTKSTDRHDSNSGVATGLVWQRMLKTTSEEEAKERAFQMLGCNSVEFNEDGSAYFNCGPMNPIREFEGKKVWFNTILGYESKDRDGYVSFDDGTRLPSDAIDAFNRILEENCVDVSWQKGDVLLVNNLLVQHARRPGKSPRVLFLSLSN